MTRSLIPMNYQPVIQRYTSEEALSDPARTMTSIMSLQRSYPSIDHDTACTITKAFLEKLAAKDQDHLTIALMLSIHHCRMGSQPFFRDESRDYKETLVKFIQKQLDILTATGHPDMYRQAFNLAERLLPENRELISELNVGTLLMDNVIKRAMTQSSDAQGLEIVGELINEKRHYLEQPSYIKEESKTLSHCQLLIKKAMELGDNDSMQVASTFLFVSQRVNSAGAAIEGTKASKDSRRFRYVFDDVEKNYKTLKKFYKKLRNIDKCEDVISNITASKRIEILKDLTTAHLDIGHDQRNEDLCDVVIDQVLQMDKLHQKCDTISVTKNIIEIFDKTRDTQNKNMKFWGSIRHAYQKAYRETHTQELLDKSMAVTEKAASFYGLIADQLKESPNYSYLMWAHELTLKQYGCYADMALVKEHDRQVPHKNRQICVSRLEPVIDTMIGYEGINRDPDRIADAGRFLQTPDIIAMTTMQERMPLYHKILQVVHRGEMTLSQYEQLMDVAEIMVSDMYRPEDADKFPENRILKSLFSATGVKVTKPVDQDKSAIDSFLHVFKSKVEECHEQSWRSEDREFKDALQYRAQRLHHLNDGRVLRDIPEHMKNLRLKHRRKLTGHDERESSHQPDRLKGPKPD